MQLKITIDDLRPVDDRFERTFDAIPVDAKLEYMDAMARTAATRDTLGRFKPSPTPRPKRGRPPKATPRPKLARWEREKQRLDSIKGRALSPREIEVAKLVAEGHSNSMIGIALDISEHTAKYHLLSLMTKLDVDNRAAVAAAVVRMGLA